MSVCVCFRCKFLFLNKTVSQTALNLHYVLESFWINDIFLPIPIWLGLFQMLWEWNNWNYDCFFKATPNTSNAWLNQAEFGSVIESNHRFIHCTIAIGQFQWYFLSILRNQRNCILQHSIFSYYIKCRTVEFFKIYNRNIKM